MKHLLFIVNATIYECACEVCLKQLGITCAAVLTPGGHLSPNRRQWTSARRMLPPYYAFHACGRSQIHRERVHSIEGSVLRASSRRDNQGPQVAKIIILSKLDGFGASRSCLDRASPGSILTSSESFLLQRLNVNRSGGLLRQ
jgi:hypothetical protein